MTQPLRTVATTLDARSRGRHRAERKAMRNLLLLSLVAVLLVLPASASAAPIRECGAYGWDEDRNGPRVLEDDEIVGAGVYNITTRKAPCWRAYKIVRRYWHNYSDYCGNSGTCRIGWGYTCRTRSLGIELQDTRCTASRGRVVRFQSGA